MKRLFLFLGVAAFVAVVVVQIPASQTTALALPPDDKAPPAAAKELSGIERYIKLLNEEVDISVLHQPGTKFANVIEFLSSKANTGGRELPIQVARMDFVRENPDAPDIFDTDIRFSPSVKKLTRAMLLREALSHLPTNNGTFLVRDDGIRITTLSNAMTPVLLREKVLAAYEKQPLQNVLRELARKIGVSVVFDPRGKEKLVTPVTATFTNDVSMASAFDMLADMAELKCVIRQDSVYVTTPEHFKAVDKENQDAQKKLLNMLKQQPGAGGGGLGGPGVGLGGGLGLGGGAGLGGGGAGLGGGGFGIAGLAGGGVGGIGGGCFVGTPHQSGFGGFNFGGGIGGAPIVPNPSFDPGRWHQRSSSSAFPGLGL